MKPRHARAIRAGIQAARSAWEGDYMPMVVLTDLGHAAMEAEAANVVRRQEKPAARPPEATETFTHPTTPTAANKAAGDKPAPLPPAIDITALILDSGDIQFLDKENDK